MMKRSRETTGTARRSPRNMDGPGTVFELADERRDLRRDLEFTSADRAAKTLAKTDGLRVTLVLLKRGATLHPEAAAGGATLHIVEGQIRVQTRGENWNVGPADVIVLGGNLREAVTALEEAAFLVTVAWPAGAGASAQEAAQADPQHGSDTAVSVTGSPAAD
jgi:quercetin dioxygenase-like cupin family protein